MIIRILLFGFVVVSATNLFPENQEITFRYHATVKSTPLPDVLSSGFGIDAYVVVADVADHNVLVQIKDVKFTAYSGKQINSELPSNIPKAANALSKPFVIKYDQYWLASSVLMPPDDPEWSINMKKAIASILQLDDRRYRNEHNTTFFESTLYGECETNYARSNSKLGASVRKQIQPNRCGSFRWKSDVALVDIVDHDLDPRPTVEIDRIYELKKHQIDYEIYQIYSTNKIQFEAIGYKGRPILTTIIQNFIRTENRSLIQQAPDFDGWSVNPIEITFNSSDLTGGRSVVNQNNAMEKTMREINNIASSFRSRMFGLNGDIKLEEVPVYRALQLLNLLTYEEFNNIYISYHSSKNKVDKERLRVFWSLIPYVGTRQSVLFIRDSIWARDLDIDVAERILVTYPAYYKNPDQYVVGIMYRLMVSDNLKKEHRAAAILSTASILGRSLAQHPKNEQLLQIQSSFIYSFETSSDPFMKTVYASALKNIGSTRTQMFLQSLIMDQNEEVKVSTEMRSLILWSENLEQNPELVKKMYWPLFLNNSEDTRIRAAALRIIMKSPEPEDLIRLKELYDGDLPSSLRALIRTNVKSVMNIKSPLYNRTMKLMMETFNKDIFNNEFDASIDYIHNYVFDYVDSRLGFGTKMKSTLFGNLFEDNYFVFHFQLSSLNDEYAINGDGLLFYLSIENEKIRQEIIEDYNKRHKQYIRQLSEVIMNMDLPQKVFLLKGDQVVGVYNDLDIVISNFEVLNKKMKKRAKNIVYLTDFKVNAEIIVPTDLGLPLHSIVHIMSMSRVDHNRTRSQTGLTVKANQLKVTHVFACSKIYNPILDLWHGSKRIQAALLNVPNHYSLDMLRSQFVLFNTEDGRRLNGGLRIMASRYIFVEDASHLDSKVAKKRLQSSCSDCKTETAILGDSIIPNFESTVFHYTNENLGVSVTTQLSGSGETSSRSSDIHMAYLANMIYDHKYYNDQGMYLPMIMLRIDYFWRYLVLFPTDGQCDYEFNIYPLYDRNVFNFTMAGLLDNITITHEMVTDSKTIRTWKLDLSQKNHDYGKEINAVFTGNENQKYCVNSNITMFGYHLDYEFNLTMGGEECEANRTILDLTVKGSIPEYFDPIATKENIYEKCIAEQSLTYKCVQDLTSLRRYEVEFNLGEESKLLNNKITKFMYYPDGERRPQMIIDVDPVKNELNFTNKYTPTLDPVPWPFKSLSPHVTPLAQMYYNLQQTIRCVLTTEQVFNADDQSVFIQADDSFKEWILVAGVNQTDGVWMVLIKRTDSDKIVLRFSDQNNELGVMLGDNGSYMIYDNGVESTMDNHKRYSKEWYLVTVSKSMYIHFYRTKVNVIYSGSTLQLDLPNNESAQTLGQCFL